jgi:iron complex outermembrane receptor protein
MNTHGDRRHARAGGALRARVALPAILLLWIAARGAGAGETSPRGADLASLSLEELMNVEVTLATRGVQKLFDAAAAVYVITAEDIRRSGASSIPEALRMVPGLHVARSGSSKWAISARGFTDEFANKLLVLVDGRTVYTPVFAGVFWDTQDLLLEDVARIEIIRGPGASLWGANAVNGIINIVTRDAAATVGALVSTQGGSADRAVVGARYGGTLGPGGHYRVWARYTDRASFSDLAGRAAADDWQVLRGGGRLQWRRRADTFTLDGAVYDGDIGWTNTQSTLDAPFTRTYVGRFSIRGGHLLGRWQRAFSSTSEAELQLYYDRTERGDVEETRDTFDAELHHSFALGRSRLHWGVGFRRSSDATLSTPVTTFDPSARTLDLCSAFVQDEIEIAGGRGRVVLGAKLEHNDFTGLEVQPTARAAWFPTPRQVVWTAASRAVRTPSQGDHGVRYTSAVFPDAAGTVEEVRIVGDPSFASEELLAWELGYRVRPASTLSFDISTFLHDYHDLRTLEPGPPQLVPDSGRARIVLPQVVHNGKSGRALGVEVAVHWAPTTRWRLAAGFAGLGLKLHPYPDSLDTHARAAEGDSPERQLHVRSFLDLPGDLELDAAFYHASSLPNRGVPSWSRLDVMVGWRPTPSMELRAGLQDVLDGGQLEFDRNVGGRAATEIPRAAYARLQWRF